MTQDFVPNLGLFPTQTISPVFFAQHLDSLMVTLNSHPPPRLGTIFTIPSDPRLIGHLPRLAKPQSQYFFWFLLLHQ